MYIKKPIIIIGINIPKFVNLIWHSKNVIAGIKLLQPKRGGKINPKYCTTFKHLINEFLIALLYKK